AALRGSPRPPHRARPADDRGFSGSAPFQLATRGRALAAGPPSLSARRRSAGPRQRGHARTLPTTYFKDDCLKVDTTLSSRALQFVDSVLALRPKIAVFDCDGTLWSGDSGADFFYWEIERGLISPEITAWALPRYEEYKAGNVAEEVMC